MKVKGYMYPQMKKPVGILWKPECVLSFNMGWQIFHHPMLKLPTHSGFHDLFLNLSISLTLLILECENWALSFYCSQNFKLFGCSIF
jgi:hypothetical protein